MIITREKGMRMWGGGSGNTSVSGASSGGGFSLTVAEGEGTGNAYTDFTYESGKLTLNKATEFVTVDFFNKLFTAYDANGNVIAPNNTTPTLDNIKFKAGAWTEQYLSALGQNSSGGGGGGGGIELSDVWQSLKTNTDDYANQKINAAHIPDLSGTYATKTWVNQQGFVTSSGVTSVAMSVPTGLSISGTPITSTGTLALTFATGYSIPTNTKQSNWDTAYGWGNHATAGYALASDVYSSSASRTKNYVLAAPSTANGAATFRKLVASDIPDLSSTYATDARADTLEGYFTNGVANTAAKLNTPKTIWGQSFDGTANVSGTLTDTGSILPLESVKYNIGSDALSYKYVYATWVGSPTNNILQFGANNQNHITVTTNGNVGIGTTSPSYKLHVVGTVGVSNAITLTGSTASARRIYFGDTSHYLELDSTGFHFSHGVYSDSFISALGANSSGGGSGTFDEEAMWTALGTTSTAKVIASSHIPNLSASKITSGTFAAARIPIATASAVGGIKVGTTLAISEGVLNQKSGVATAGTYRSVTVDTYGRVTAGTNPTTLSGYGITDAKIVNGTITLGSNSITPITSHQSLAHLVSMHTQDNYDLNEIGTSGGMYRHSNTPTNAFPNASYGNTIVVGADYDTCFQLGAPYSTNELYFRTGTWYSDGTGTLRTNSWRQVAFTDSNVASATKLQTARTVWGQNFDGTGNVSGTLIDTGSILPLESVKYNIGSDSLAYRYVYATWVGSPTNNILQFGANNQNHITVTTDGNVGIGTTSPSYKLDVSGAIRASNYVYVGTGGAYVASNSAANIYLQNSSGSVLVCESKVVRRGTDLSDVTLGSSSYPWLAAYATTFYGALNGNAATATKLQTARTIWGQNFDGTANVSGTLTDTGSILPSESVTHDIGSNALAYKYVYATWVGSPTNKILQFGANNQYHITVTTDGNVGIGTTSPSQKLHVTGNILASGEVTASSDGRKKNIISNTKFSVRDIASARSVLFEWNDGRDDDMEKKIHGGSIAQDWLGKADSFLMQDGDGFYSINYGALALCSAITIARMTINHEDRITLLEKENAKLKARVEELEERRA